MPPRTDEDEENSFRLKGVHVTADPAPRTKLPSLIISKRREQLK